MPSYVATLLCMYIILLLQFVKTTKLPFTQSVSWLATWSKFCAKVTLKLVTRLSDMVAIATMIVL